MEKHVVIGLMSGTSLDGLDIACCRFTRDNGHWTYEIECAETIPYTREWKSRLAEAGSGTALEFVSADVDYGHLLGSWTRDFIGRNRLSPGFIASHGHTVFHQPDRRITSQIGRGSAIAAETGLPVVCDFRSLDVALGGQGAPLVPIGDELLFAGYDCCLNIGGFANISFRAGGRRVAFDICPANIVMNDLASELGMEYDKGGYRAAAGIVHQPLLNTLNSLPYYERPWPKSLGKEWVVQNIYPLVLDSSIPADDRLATFCEHIAIQVALSTRSGHAANMLITGGGAFNEFLTGRIRRHAGFEVILPDPLTISFKEALIFAFLGLLRRLNETNCLQSVTGAGRDSSGGAIY